MIESRWRRRELRGIARVLTFEHPELKTTVVDVEAEGAGSLAALTEELLAGSDQDEVALRDGQRYVNRLVPAPTTATGDLAVESRRTVVNLDGAASAVRLQIDQPGRLDALSGARGEADSGRKPVRSRFVSSPRGSTSATCSRRWACIRDSTVPRR